MLQDLQGKGYSQIQQKLKEVIEKGGSLTGGRNFPSGGTTTASGETTSSSGAIE